MTRLPSLRPRKLVAVLKKAGFSETVRLVHIFIFNILIGAKLYSPCTREK